ncbi:MAG TPA: hypothetical protein VNA04_01090, partial [Thermoanaerobaculia bacterium]|nr:hypothetical protein [Thermoanaerobaculia bacterium]
MRAPVVLLLLVCTVVDARLAAQIPPPSAPEVAVAEPVYAAAPLEQIPMAADSNGDIALVAWNDNRSGATVAYAARVDQEGKALDPLGIRLTGGSPKAVIWTGEEFLVVVEVPGRHELFFIDVDGLIVERTPIDVAEPFVAASDGESIRLLFLSWQRVVVTQTTALRGHLVDPIRESPRLRAISLPPTPAGYADIQWIGGTNGSEILLLRLQRLESGAGPDRLVAERINAAADLVSSTETGLQVFIDSSDELAGNDDGYVLVKHVRTEVPGVRSFRLTAAGAYTGATHTLAPPVPPAFAQIRLARDGSRYLLAWWVPDP